MSQERPTKKELDAFWDISSLVPQKNRAYGKANSAAPNEVRFERPIQGEEKKSSSDGSVIKRYIYPNAEQGILRENQYESETTYEPTESLIHKVTLQKKKCSYRYYEEFYRDAIRYKDRVGKECPFVPFFSYVPQYNQLNQEQLNYYFYFRDQIRRGIYPKTDCSYVLLYVFELINLGSLLNVRKTQHCLVELWKRYSGEFVGISGKLADWICDFSLIHQLPPPSNADTNLVSKVVSLREFYIPMPHGDLDRCVSSLLRYCCSYDYKTSKFATEQNEELFRTHIHRAVRIAAEFFSSDGHMLSNVTFEDSSMIRDAYAGALCSSYEQYRISVQYCSFSRSNELRFLIGDVVKYTENRLRSFLGIKSKMSVYSVPMDLKKLLDQYFDVALVGRRRGHRTAEKPAYEALYDVPQKKLSLKDAAAIEQASWETTRCLIEAFDPVEDPLKTNDAKPTSEAVKNDFAVEGDNIDLPDADGTTEKNPLAVYGDLLVSMLQGDIGAIGKASREKGILSDAFAEMINELAYEEIGDALIEECEGGYRIIEDYEAYVRELF